MRAAWFPDEIQFLSEEHCWCHQAHTPKKTEKRRKTPQKLFGWPGIVDNLKVGILEHSFLGWPTQLTSFLSRYRPWNTRKSWKKCQNKRKSSNLATRPNLATEILVMKDSNGSVTPGSFSLIIVLKIPSQNLGLLTTFGGSYSLWKLEFSGFRGSFT